MPPDRRLLREIASATDRAYIAGLIDADGTVGFKITGKGNAHGYVWVYSSDFDLVAWLLSFGGTLTTREPRIGGLQKLLMHRWSVQNNRDVLALLGMVVPYMRIKKAKALTVLEVVQARVREKDIREELAQSRTESVLKFHNDGHNPNKISKLIGCSRHVVVTTLEREGFR